MKSDIKQKINIPLSSDGEYFQTHLISCTRSGWGGMGRNFFYDVDNDGKIEWVSCGSGQWGDIYEEWHFYEWNGVDYIQEGYFTVSDSSFDWDVGDVDGDGKLELLLGNRNHHFYVYNMDSDSYTQQVDYNYGSEINHVISGDLKGTGKDEIIMGNNENWGIYTVSGNSLVTEKSQANSEWVHFYGAGDFDNDGKEEFVGINNARNIGIYGYNSDYELESIISTYVGEMSVLNIITDDDEPEIVVSDQTTIKIYDYVLGAYQNVATLTNMSYSNSHYACEVFDVDSDGKQELLVAYSPGDYDLYEFDEGSNTFSYQEKVPSTLPCKEIGALIDQSKDHAEFRLVMDFNDDGYYEFVEGGSDEAGTGYSALTSFPMSYNNYEFISDNINDDEKFETPWWTIGIIAPVLAGIILIFPEVNTRIQNFKGKRSRRNF